MKHSFKTGLSFGSTSAIITTLGLMVGLHSGTKSKVIVIGAILTIAIADSFSDALGIHLSEEAENIHTVREIWEAALSTFLYKFIFTLTFLVPVFLLKLSTAIIISVIWGLLLLGVFSLYIAKDQKVKSWLVIREHLIIAILVIVATHYIGKLIAKFF